MYIVLFKCFFCLKFSFIGFLVFTAFFKLQKCKAFCSRSRYIYIPAKHIYIAVSHVLKQALNWLLYLEDFLKRNDPIIDEGDWRKTFRWKMYRRKHGIFYHLVHGFCYLAGLLRAVLPANVFICVLGSQQLQKYCYFLLSVLFCFAD